MKFTTRELVTLTVFGTLWGLVEMTLGSLLHALNIPLSGTVLAAAGLTIALIGRLFVPRRGSTFFIGVIATILKLFSIGSVVIGPMIGILIEAAVAEIVLSIFRKPSRVAFTLAGASGVLWSLGQPFFTGLVLFGRELFVIWLDMIDRGGQLLGIDSGMVWWILIFLATVHIAAGIMAGLLAWSVGITLRSRLDGSFLLSTD
jgi:ABC-type thiamin/hydroxymethylpyrimidine transport system permease subunit